MTLLFNKTEEQQLHFGVGGKPARLCQGKLDLGCGELPT